MPHELSSWHGLRCKQ